MSNSAVLLLIAAVAAVTGTAIQFNALTIMDSIYGGVLFIVAAVLMVGSIVVRQLGRIDDALRSRPPGGK